MANTAQQRDTWTPVTEQKRQSAKNKKFASKIYAPEKFSTDCQV